MSAETYFITLAFDKKAYMKEYNARKHALAKGALGGQASPGSSSPVGMPTPKETPKPKKFEGPEYGMGELTKPGAPAPAPTHGGQVFASPVLPQQGDFGRKEFKAYGNDGREALKKNRQEAHVALKKEGFVKEGNAVKDFVPSQKMGKSLAYTIPTNRSTHLFNHPDGRKAAVQLKTKGSETTLVVKVQNPGEQSFYLKALGLRGAEHMLEYVTDGELPLAFRDGMWHVLSQDKMHSLGSAATLTLAKAKQRRMKIKKVVSAYSEYKAAASADFETVDFEGRPHLKVPIIALREGVIHASNAKEAELVLASELERTVAGWNGRPLMMNHPENADGRKVTANSPDKLTFESFGKVFDARVEDKALRMNAYIDIEKAAGVPGAQEILDRVREGKPVEVSVGTFVEAEPRAGSFNGKAYRAVWKNPIPDHLALLPPGIKGACNNNMGCGVRTAADGAVRVIALAFNKTAYMAEYNRRRAKKANFGLGGKGGEAKFKKRQQKQYDLLKKLFKPGKQVAGGLTKPPSPKKGGQDKPKGSFPKGFKSKMGKQVRTYAGFEALAFDKAAYMKMYNAKKKGAGGGGTTVGGPDHKVNVKAKPSATTSLFSQKEKPAGTRHGFQEKNTKALSNALRGPGVGGGPVTTVSPRGTAHGWYEVKLTNPSDKKNSPVNVKFLPNDGKGGANKQGMKDIGVFDNTSAASGAMFDHATGGKTGHSKFKGFGKPKEPTFENVGGEYVSPGIAAIMKGGKPKVPKSFPKNFKL